MADTRGLMQRLQEKSADELKKLEAGSAPLLQEDLPPQETEAERKERERIEERIRMFRAGEDPDAKKGLVAAGEFDDFALHGDPMTHHLQGEYAASPKEEKQLAKVVKNGTDFIFGDKMHAVIQKLKSKEPFEAISETVIAIVAKEKAEMEGRGEEFKPAVFFAETGAVPILTDALWDLAKQVGVPGANDQDQYAASLINTFKLAGEHVIASGDERAIEEAEELVTQMAMTRPDGSMIEEHGTSVEVEAKNIERKQLAKGISAGLLGGVA